MTYSKLLNVKLFVKISIICFLTILNFQNAANAEFKKKIDITEEQRVYRNKSLAIREDILKKENEQLKMLESINKNLEYNNKLLELLVQNKGEEAK